MKSDRTAKSPTPWICLVLLCLSAASVSAEQFGLFTYSVDGDEVTITDYPEDATGDVEIPAEIDGKPVTEIGEYAFIRCSGLTSVSIPDSVTAIGEGAFAQCTGLTSVSIPEGVTSIGLGAFSLCRGLTSVSIPDSVTSIGRSAFRNCTGLTSVSISDSVTSIGQSTFTLCTSLTSVSIPDSVTTIGSAAFSFCTGLESAIFLGDAPSSFSLNAFDNTAPDFTIYYLRESSGFTSPTWKGYPATEIGGVPVLKRLGIVEITKTKDSVTITFWSLPGRKYVIDTSTDFTFWEELDDNIEGAADSDTTSFTESPLPEGGTRYYRVRRFRLVGQQ